MHVQHDVNGPSSLHCHGAVGEATVFAKVGVY